MTKKHFIAIADAIKADRERFSEKALYTLAGAFERINPAFNRGRWLGYIAGLNGPSGGKVKGFNRTIL